MMYYNNAKIRAITAEVCLFCFKLWHKCYIRDKKSYLYHYLLYIESNSLTENCSNFTFSPLFNTDKEGS